MSTTDHDRLIHKLGRPVTFWRLLDELGFEPHRIEPSGKTVPIQETAAFTREFARSYTDVWAKRR